MGRPRRKVVVSFTTKYAFPRQIRLRILELSNFSIEKDSCRVV